MKKPRADQTTEKWISENPDLFDAADCRPERSKMSEAYFDAVLPDHVKKRIRARRTARKNPAG